jgi:pilus assembly protein CpaF
VSTERAGLRYVTDAMNYIDFPALRPIRHLLVDPEISEIMVNGAAKLFVERRGRMEELQPVFTSAGQLEVVVEALLGTSGRAVTVLSPFVDFRLSDGSRVNIAVRPIAVDGPVITIRRQTKGIARVEDLVARGALTANMERFLRACVHARLNLLFAGGTGSGKTTLLGLLGHHISPSERIVVIEDTCELAFSQPNVVRLECRPPNIEGAGGIKLTDLLKNSLRMRPTRLILGEVRGEEAFDMLSAMSSGHDGGFAVLHASSPEDAVSRLATMVLTRGLPLPLSAINMQIASAIDVIVQHAQLPDGSRRVTHITAVEGASETTVELQDLYTFEQERVGAKGTIEGRFQEHAVQPRFMPKLRLARPDLVEGLFEPDDLDKTAALPRAE